MVKKFIALIFIAVSAIAVQNRMKQQRKTKDLWSQAADQPDCVTDVATKYGSLPTV